MQKIFEHLSSLLVYMVLAWYFGKTYTWCKANIDYDMLYDMLAWMSELAFIKLRFWYDGLEDIPARDLVDSVENLLDSNLSG